MDTTVTVTGSDVRHDDGGLPATSSAPHARVNNGNKVMPPSKWVAWRGRCPLAEARYERILRPGESRFGLARACPEA
jgi:hypothetical protein